MELAPLGVFARRHRVLIATVALAIVGLVLLIPMAQSASSAPGGAASAQVGVGGLICSILQAIINSFGSFIGGFLSALLGIFGCASP